MGCARVLPRRSACLHELGVRTVGDLAAIPVETMVRRLGKASGLHLSALAHGEDPSPVTPNRPAKSLGHEETFSEDLVDPAALERHVLRMAESVATMLRGSSTAARTVTVKVKFRDLSLQTRSHTFGSAHHHRRHDRTGGRFAACGDRSGRGDPAARGQCVGSGRRRR